MRPAIQYTKSGDVNIAYQVMGEGAVDLVYVPGWISHIDYAWENPDYSGFFKRLCSFARIIFFDKRGTGLSDRDVGFPTLEARMDDVRAVMDAAGSRRAYLFGVSEGGSMSILFAATFPGRCAGLILFGCFAKGSWAPDYPWRQSEEERAAFLERVEREWGDALDLNVLAPSKAMDEEARAWLRSYLRYGASPGAARLIT